jgi:hypothetical protein
VVAVLNETIPQGDTFEIIYEAEAQPDPLAPPVAVDLTGRTYTLTFDGDAGTTDSSELDEGRISAFIQTVSYPEGDYDFELVETEGVHVHTVVQGVITLGDQAEEVGSSFLIRAREGEIVRILAQGYAVRGRTGAPGEGSGYTHSQVSPSDTWVINHNLGYRPGVAVFSSGGVLTLAEAIHMSANQTQILLNTPMAGSARLS